MAPFNLNLLEMEQLMHKIREQMQKRKRELSEKPFSSEKELSETSDVCTASVNTSHSVQKNDLVHSMPCGTLENDLTPLRPLKAVYKPLPKSIVAPKKTEFNLALTSESVTGEPASTMGDSAQSLTNNQRQQGPPDSILRGRKIIKHSSVSKKVSPGPSEIARTLVTIEPWSATPNLRSTVDHDASTAKYQRALFPPYDRSKDNSSTECAITPNAVSGKLKTASSCSMIGRSSEKAAISATPVKVSKTENIKFCPPVTKREIQFSTSSISAADRWSFPETVSVSSLREVYISNYRSSAFSSPKNPGELYKTSRSDKRPTSSPPLNTSTSGHSSEGRLSSHVLRKWERRITEAANEESSPIISRL